jgi:hypothetical protein
MVEIVVWQSHPLECMYLVASFDALQVKIRRRAGGQHGRQSGFDPRGRNCQRLLVLCVVFVAGVGAGSQMYPVVFASSVATPLAA